jgi:ribonuclease P protein component
VSPAAGKSPAPEGRYAFKKNERLRRRSEFSALFKSGKRIHSEYLTVILSTNTSDVRRLGLVVGKKVRKEAVRRNRMKRLLREFFRLNKHRLSASQDILIVARKDFSFMKYRDLCSALEEVLAGRMKA